MVTSPARSAKDATPTSLSLWRPWPGVVATGVAFMEKCGEGDVLLSDYVSEYV